MVPLGSADACTPAIHVWRVNTPKPEIVIEGLVTAESRQGVWDRSINVHPVRLLRGTWNEDVSVAVSCGAGSPLLGENAIVARMSLETAWILIPSWQRQEFLDFLRTEF